MSQKMNLKKTTGTGIPSNKIDIQIQYTKIFGVPIMKTSFPKNSIDKLVGLTDSLLKDPNHIDYSNKLAGVIKKGKQILMPFHVLLKQGVGLKFHTPIFAAKIFSDPIFITLL